MRYQAINNPQVLYGSRDNPLLEGATVIMRGWIALYRSIIDHWIWNTSSRRLQRWIDLIFLATWQPEKEVFFGSGLVKVKRGQYATSTRRLMQRWHTNNHVVGDTLKLFESAGMISIDRKRNWMIITVCNYEKYQFAALKAQSMLGDGEDMGHLMSELNGQNMSPSLHSEMQESGGVQLQNQLLNKEDNNIKKNNSSSSVREWNLKFFEDLKNNEVVIQEMKEALRCSDQQVLDLLETFVREVNISEKSHVDSNDFKKHFYYWAKMDLGNQKRNGTRRKQTEAGGEDSQDKYEARRGFDAGDHTEEDYSTSFSV